MKEEFYELMNAEITEETNDLIDDNDYIYDGNDVFQNGKHIIAYRSNENLYELLATGDMFDYAKDAILECAKRQHRRPIVWNQTDDGEFILMELS